MGDVMKHFERKLITDENDLLERLPASPTPSVLSCTTVMEMNDQVVSPQSSITSAGHNNSLPAMVVTDNCEVALRAVRSLA